ncbi:MAG: phosphotransferase [Pseudomonadota bacterium]
MTPPLAAWGLDGTPAPLPGGYRNTVLRVGVHVLKTTRRSEAAVAWLVPVMDALGARGLSAPHPIRAADGHYVVDGWTCEPFVAGQPCDPQALRQLWPRLTGFPQRPGFAAAKTLQYLPRGGDVDLSRMPPPLVRALRKAWGALTEQGTCVVHGDLNHSNLIRTAYAITVIDWDEARMDHPGFDRAALAHASHIEARAAQAWEIACCWHLEPTRARRLARAFIINTRRRRNWNASPC